MPGLVITIAIQITKEEIGTIPPTSGIMQENGDFLLQENGDYLLQE